MKQTVQILVAILFVAASGACGPLEEAMEGHTRVVARVDGMALTVEDAARMLASAAEGVAPEHPLVVDSLTDLWVAYTALAKGFAGSDTFGNVDVGPMIELNRQQKLVWHLHEDVIIARTAPSESELREAYEREQPWAQVKVSHILIPVPPNAGPDALERLRARAAEVERRAKAGEDFAQLAREFSGDPSTAAEGGQIGWIRRGTVLPELESVVFQMKPGDVSDVIRSQAGFHVLRVTDRRSPEFETVRDDYRLEIVDRRFDELERSYVDSLFASFEVRLTRTAISVARRTARSPKLERLEPAMGRVVLAEFEGGRFTVDQFADVLLGSPQLRGELATADSARAESLLLQMIRHHLLVRVARERGYEVTQAELDSMRHAARLDLQRAARAAGFDPDTLRQGDDAVRQAVERAIRDLLTRQRSPATLEAVAHGLRAGRSIQVYPQRFADVVARFSALKGRPDRNNDQAIRVQ